MFFKEILVRGIFFAGANHEDMRCSGGVISSQGLVIRIGVRVQVTSLTLFEPF
jgi:hypothetical protein